MGAVLLRIVEGDPLLQVGAGPSELTAVQQGNTVAPAGATSRVVGTAGSAGPAGPGTSSVCSTTGATKR